MITPTATTGEFTHVVSVNLPWSPYMSPVDAALDNFSYNEQQPVKGPKHRKAKR